jgi:hypothetical protein
VWDLLHGQFLDTHDNKRALTGFHVEHLDGVAVGCRVNYLGQEFEVVAVNESTLRGIEIICGQI